jgi:hypothetical protein
MPLFSEQSDDCPDPITAPREASAYPALDAYRQLRVAARRNNQQVCSDSIGQRELVAGWIPQQVESPEVRPKAQVTPEFMRQLREKAHRPLGCRCLIIGNDHIKGLARGLPLWQRQVVMVDIHVI